jgi:ERCC4-type nuclease
MSNIILEIDSRERKLIEDINSRYPYIKYNTKNLDIGDIVLTYKKEDILFTFIIERKTIQDCVASIKDNRYKEQKLRNKSYVRENNNTIFFYLLEGNIYKDVRHKCEISMVHGFIISNQFRDNIHIIRTLTLKETSDILIKLIDRINKKPGAFFKDLDNVIQPLQTNKMHTNLETIHTTSLNQQIKSKDETPTITVNKVNNLNTTDISAELYTMEDNLLLLEYKIDLDSIKIINISTKSKSIEEQFITNSIASTNKDNNIDLSNKASIVCDNTKTIVLDLNKNKASNETYNQYTIKNKSKEHLDSRIKKKKQDNLTPELCQQLMLTNIPGISSQLSIELLKHFKNVYKLISIVNDSTKDKDSILKELQEIKINTSTGKIRKLGTSLSSKIIEYLCYSS